MLARPDFGRSLIDRSLAVTMRWIMAVVSGARLRPSAITGLAAAVFTIRAALVVPIRRLFHGNAVAPAAAKVRTIVPPLFGATVLPGLIICFALVAVAVPAFRFPLSAGVVVG